MDGAPKERARRAQLVRCASIKVRKRTVVTPLPRRFVVRSHHYRSVERGT